jgi:hypothetical protein
MCSIPSESAREKVNRYIEENKLVEPGLVFIDNNNSSGILIEPILSKYDMESQPLFSESIKDGIVVEDGQIFQDGYCLRQFRLTEEEDYKQQLYMITSKKKIREEPQYLCLLNIVLLLDEQNKENKYITSVVYARRDKRPNKDLRRLVAYFLDNASLTRTIDNHVLEQVQENTYKVMHLMERPIRLPCNSTGHLMTYKSIKPPHLLTISLQDSFNPEVNHLLSLFAAC